MDRRNFIKTTAVSAAGAVMIPAITAKAKPSVKVTDSVTRTLGKTGLVLPVISMGVMRSDNPNLVKAALNSGIKHLDTAHGYQGGRNEEMLGNLLKQFQRDSFVIATKVKGSGMSEETGMYTDGASPQDFTDKFHLSLKRLQMDYVDILYMHAVSTKEAVMYEPYMKVMEQFKKDGKVRFLGVSTHKNEPDVIRAVAGSNFYDVVLTAVNFQQDHYAEIKSAIAEAAAKGVGIVGMKTMAGGYVDRERKIPVDAKAAVKFVLQDENVHTTIPGFTTFDELETTVSVLQDITLQKEEMEKLDLLKSQGSLYCNGCSTCVKQCHKRLPVPEIMRSYMYAYGYNHTRDAQHLLGTLNISDNPCGDCSLCPVRCTKHFNVREKISDIVRLNKVPSEFLV